LTLWMVTTVFFSFVGSLPQGECAHQN
jgi:transposase, IS6 family